MIDVLGFIGSGLIVVSLTMKSIMRLRVIGLAGALVFIAYGVWLGAWPVVATNIVTFSIHVIRLREAMNEAAVGDRPSLPVPSVPGSVAPTGALAGSGR